MRNCRAIWITHAHLDHIGGIAAVLREWKVPVYLHPLDRPLYDRGAQQAAAYGIPFESPPAPDRELAEGDELALGALRFGVMHLPGHAPGHVAFYGHGMLFSGDVLFAGSIGRTDLPLSNPAHLERSLERLATLPPETGPCGPWICNDDRRRAADQPVPDGRGADRAPMNRSMRLHAAALFVAAWIGAALITVAVVAPGAFAVLPSRTMAGTMVGRVLPALFISGMVIGILVAVVTSSAPSAARPAGLRRAPSCRARLLRRPVRDHPETGPFESGNRGSRWTRCRPVTPAAWHLGSFTGITWQGWVSP